MSDLEKRLPWIFGCSFTQASSRFGWNCSKQKTIIFSGQIVVYQHHCNIHWWSTQLCVPRRDERYYPLPNTHKSIIDCLFRFWNGSTGFNFSSRADIMPKSVFFHFQLPIPHTHTHRCKYLEHLNLSGLDEHSTPADYNDLLHSAEVELLIWMLMLSKTICGAPGEGALPQLDRGRLEGVAQPGQPQPWHPRQQRHPQDCQQNLPKVLVVIKV